MLLVLWGFLGLNCYDAAKGGHWLSFTFSFVEASFMAGILFWMGVDAFNARQRRRRVAANKSSPT